VASLVQQHLQPEGHEQQQRADQPPTNAGPLRKERAPVDGQGLCSLDAAERESCTEGRAAERAEHHARR